MTRTATLDGLRPLLNFGRFENRQFSSATVTVIEDVTPSDVLFWGFAPVAPLHIGYDKLFFTIASIQRVTGCRVVFFVADTYARLSRPLQGDPKLVGAYYRRYVEKVWEIEAEWIHASDLIRTPEYIEALLDATRMVKISDVKESWRKDDRGAAFVYGAVYPLMQALDVCIIRPTIVFAEQSQEKFFRLLARIETAATENFAVSFVYTAQSCDLRGKPLKGSSGRDRLSLHESEESLRKKLSRTATIVGSEHSPVAELVLYSLWPFAFLDAVLSSDFATARAEVSALRIELPRDLDLLASAFNHRLRDAASAFDKAPRVADWIDVTRLRAE